LLLVELEIGKGWLTVLSDLRFMNNRKIGDYDHAYFTLKLFNIPKTTSLWLVEYGDMPSLLRLIRRHAWAPLLMLALFVVVYLAYAGPRLGPLKPASVPVRRSMMEHVAAAGRFLWRRRQDAILLQSAQQAVYDKITRFQPMWLKLPEDRLFERLAKLSGQAPEEVRFAFSAERAEKELEFTRAMKTIQKIGKAL
jgi:hypothetical protein